MPRRVMQGVVVQNTADKTVSVRVQSRIKHPLYDKYISQSKKFLAHDEKNEFQIGDEVSIKECAPISKNKTFYVLEKKSA